MRFSDYVSVRRPRTSLASTPQQTVSTEEQEIMIEPANPEIVYVPVYNPWCVYGAWPYPDYPPFYFEPWSGYCVPADYLLAFGAGFYPFGFWAWGHFDWRHHIIRIDHDRFQRFHTGHEPRGGIWQHDPAHRHGVPYRDPATAARFLGPAGAARGYRGFAPRRQRRPRSSLQSHWQARLGRTGGVRRRAFVAPQRPLPPAFQSYGPGSQVRGESERGFSSRMTPPRCTKLSCRTVPSFHGGGGALAAVAEAFTAAAAAEAFTAAVVAAAGVDEVMSMRLDRAMLRNAANRFLIALRLGAGAMGLMAIAAVPAMAAAASQKTFATPAAAVDALIAANRGNHLRKLLAILGPEGAKLIHSGDPVADRRGRRLFVAAYDRSPQTGARRRRKAILIVGADEWPLPIPLVREHARWRFDTKAGADEILNRRIGRNELSVIEVCRAYVAAQREYAAKNLGPGGAAEYAQHFMSKIGQRDGLYWPVKAGEQESPLGPLIARARAAGYRPGTPHPKPRPYYGYYFHILTQQGQNAPGGARNYVVNDHMTGGFALIAYPATYGDSGIMTFIVNQDGIVYQKNLGPDTQAHRRQITQYDPDGSWQASQP